jgi:hypothetical protein
MVYILIGTEDLKDKAAVAAVLQQVRVQGSRSVVVTDVVPTWGGTAIHKIFHSVQKKPLSSATE